MGRSKIFVSILAIFFLLGLDNLSCFASAVDAANAGIKAIEEGNKDKAKILFKSALRSNELSKKNYIIVNNNLCRILWSELKIHKAIGCYSETLYLDADNLWARRSRGLLYNKLGNHEKAIEDLSCYINLSPRDDFGYTQRAMSYCAIKEYEMAIFDLNKAVQLKANKEEGYIHRGNTYFQTGNYHLALADFEKAIAVDPKSSAPYQAMAWFYATCPERDFRDGARALTFAKKSLEIGKKNKRNPLLYDALAAAYAELGQFQKAIETQKQAIKLLKGDKKYFEELKHEIENRLDLYENGKAYRAI